MITRSSLLNHQSVGTRIGDRLRAGITSLYVTSHSGQLSFLPYVGRELSTEQSAVMRCGWGVKAGWIVSFVDKCVGGRKYCAIPREHVAFERFEGKFTRKCAIRLSCLQLIQNLWCGKKWSSGATI